MVVKTLVHCVLGFTQNEVSVCTMSLTKSFILLSCAKLQMLTDTHTCTNEVCVCTMSFTKSFIFLSNASLLQMQTHTHMHKWSLCMYHEFYTKLFTSSYHVQGSFQVQTAWLLQACTAPTLSPFPLTLWPTIRMNWGYQTVLCIVTCHQGFT